MSDLVGFIGLGQLGLPMATNLLDAGYPLLVYNRTARKADPMLARSARLATQPVDAVTTGGIVATIVWDDAALEGVVMGDGFLERLGPGGVHLSMSTVSPETSRRLAALHARHGSTYVAAPIFGRPEAAIARQLWVPMSGPQGAKERVRPLLTAMGGQGIFDIGEDAGAANIVKLVGNFLIGSAAYSMREALAMADREGVDPKVVVDMLTQTLFNAPIYRSYGALIAAGTAPFGQIDQSGIGLKDTGLFRDTAHRVGSPTPVADRLYEILRSDGGRAS